MNFLKYRTLTLSFSAIVFFASIAAIFVFGLRLGTDFTGGTLWEFSIFEQASSPGTLREELLRIGVVAPTVQVSQNSFIVRTKELSEEDHQRFLSELRVIYPHIEEQRFDSVGPAIGNELKQKAFIAISFAIVGILLYIAFVFRKVPRPTSSWKFSFATIIALAHDVLITIGIFALLGKYYGVEIGLPFVAAVLTILGYSVNDTVVVFDRIRENLLKQRAKSFNDIVEISLRQTIVRSVITSVLVIVALFIILLWGGQSIFYFALALFIGVAFGTYSSIFVATFLLTLFQRGSASTIVGKSIDALTKTR